MVKKKNVKKAKKKAVKKTSAKKTVKKKVKKSGKKISRKKSSSSKPKNLKKKTTKKIAKKTGRKTKTKTKPKARPKKRAKKIEQLIKDMLPEQDFTEQRKIEESKFNIGVPENAHAVPLYEIPGEYHQKRAIVLTVSPDFVFAYWEVPQQAMQEANNKIGNNAKLNLRFYDITQTNSLEEAPCWDVEVFDRLGNWYLRLDYPEQKICMEVGLKNDTGHFYSITRSNIIKLPRKVMAQPQPLKWMVVSPDGQKIITDVENYTQADMELLKKILGPHFFDLLKKGEFSTISGSNLEAVFQEISSLRNIEDVSSSPTQWSK